VLHQTARAIAESRMINWETSGLDMLYVLYVRCCVLVSSTAAVCGCLLVKSSPSLEGTCWLTVQSADTIHIRDVPQLRSHNHMTLNSGLAPNHVMAKHAAGKPMHEQCRRVPKCFDLFFAAGKSLCMSSCCMSRLLVIFLLV
jgi:hypothetical protein